jgi:hypothetical protein
MIDMNVMNLSPSTIDDTHAPLRLAPPQQERLTAPGAAGPGLSA